MQNKKREFLRRAKAAGLFRLARQRTAPGIRILCYHGLWQNDDEFAGDSMFMKQDTFRRRLEIIRREGYPVVPLSAAASSLQGRGPALPPASVVITIDDGWLSTYNGMLPALEAQGMSATLYCDSAQLLSGQPIAHVMARYLLRVVQAGPRALQAESTAATEALRVATDLTRSMDERFAAASQLADAIGIDKTPYLKNGAFNYMTPEQLRTAQTRGLDVQLHTHRHTLGDMSRAVITEEIALNRSALAKALGTQPQHFKHFCYPSGVLTSAAAATLGGLDLESSTTTEQGIAWPGMPMHLLPRLLDGENLSEIEFEAELSGFSDWMRRI